MPVDQLPNPANHEVIRATETEHVKGFVLRRRDPSGSMPWLEQDTRTQYGIQTATENLNEEE